VQLAIYWRLLASIRGWLGVGHDVAALDRQFDVTSYIALFSTVNGREATRMDEETVFNHDEAIEATRDLLITPLAVTWRLKRPGEIGHCSSRLASASAWARLSMAK